MTDSISSTKTKAEHILTDTYSTVVLQSSTSTGKTKYWQGHVLESTSNQCYTQSSYWQSKNDGTNSVVKHSEPYLITGKNIGHSNETTARAQAILQIHRDLQKQLDKGYTYTDKEGPELLPLPMLAKKFSGSDKIVWPTYIQPKLNGQRMLRSENGYAWSRGNKPILEECIRHINHELKDLRTHYPLDGELLLPGNQLLQKTMAAIKKFRPGVSDTLVYWVYDLVNPSQPFSERYKTLRKLLPVDLPHVKLTPTILVGNYGITTQHRKFVNQGFEGSMVRCDLGGYDAGYRSSQLQKVKDYIDSEFKVIDIKSGLGKAKGTAIFVCRATDSRTFNCVPEGNLGYRQALYDNRSKILSENPYLTVRYQELSLEGVPIGNPVGVALRQTCTEGY